MRLIDADALQEKLTKKKPGPANARYTEGFNDALLRFKSMIHAAPTIELRCEECGAFNKTRLLIPQPERKKGRWIPVHTGTYEERQKIEWRCSECGAGMYRFYQKFCHECGAKMEGLKVVEDE